MTTEATSLAPHDVKLILAYVGYYQADPKCLNELLTGVCQWPPSDPLPVLMDRARAALDDLNFLRQLHFGGALGPRLCQLYAAVTVLERMEYDGQLGDEALAVAMAALGMSTVSPAVAFSKR